MCLTANAREEQALSAYREAADAYAFLARLRSLEADAVTLRGTGEEILLMGTDEESAKRFDVPFEARGTGTWAKTREALKIILAFAEKRFDEAERLRPALRPPPSDGRR